ncbi:hypothetical protein VNO78_15774 [Psophocarpus tetragonolobus]|uniref:Bowman-Birk serine protease inhibitors family domain-containing protein n=1 Tax=Psophocarpus tetragonolobus TaxID=3891 RepID=A0AAN9SFZ7_PSOTE
MELKKKVGCMVFVLGLIATVDGGIDPTSTCKSWYCTPTNPPLCGCQDIGESCHSYCKDCYCWTTLDTRKCQCKDIEGVLLTQIGPEKCIIIKS